MEETWNTVSISVNVNLQLCMRKEYKMKNPTEQNEMNLIRKESEVRCAAIWTNIYYSYSISSLLQFNGFRFVRLFHSFFLSGFFVFGWIISRTCYFNHLHCDLSNMIVNRCVSECFFLYLSSDFVSVICGFFCSLCLASQ